jgi:cytochrome c biogenesis protein CcdA
VKLFFKHFKEGMISFGKDISTIVNTLLLLIIYILGVGITSSVALVVGKKFLETDLSKDKNSYWTNLDLKKKKLDEYYSQF